MITVTEILGTDNVGASRITINNNFNTLKSAINAMSEYVTVGSIGTSTTTFIGSSATIGGVSIGSNRISINSKVLNESGISMLSDMVNTGTLWLNATNASLNIGTTATAEITTESFLQIGSETLTEDELRRLKELISGSGE